MGRKPELQIATTDRTLSPARAMFAALMMLAAAILAGLAAPGHAQSFENLDRLDGLVAMSVGANRGEPGGPVAPIDRRLRLAPCPETPRVDAPRMGAAVVSCAAAGWRIRVPLVPAEQAQKHHVSNDMRATSNSVIIKKGDPVQLVAGDGSFTISRLVIADEDGAVGALIRVRPDARAAPMMARVERLGVVRIPGI